MTRRERQTAPTTPIKNKTLAEIGAEWRAKQAASGGAPTWVSGDPVVFVPTFADTSYGQDPTDPEWRP